MRFFRKLLASRPTAAASEGRGNLTWEQGSGLSGRTSTGRITAFRGWGLGKSKVPARATSTSTRMKRSIEVWRPE